MIEIEKWLELFRVCWINKDVDSILELFNEKVEYWETPFKKLYGLSEVRSEWQAIKKQEEIKIETTIYASLENINIIQWELDYTDENRMSQKWGGIYLIELDNDGKCCFFKQVGEHDN